MFRTKALGNAILTAYELAGKDEATTAGEIAEKYELPQVSVSKVMTQLAKVRVLQSNPGSMGGYKLARPANKITLLEVFEAVNGQLGDGSIHGLSGSLGTRVQVAVGNANDAIRNVLGNTTLAALVKK